MNRLSFGHIYLPVLPEIIRNLFGDLLGMRVSSMSMCVYVKLLHVHMVHYNKITVGVTLCYMYCL